VSRRIGVLVNPTSGRGRVARRREAVLSALAGRGDEVRVIQGESADDAERLLAHHVTEGLDVLVAVGGDGTVHMALQAAVTTSTPLGIVPLGTGNDAATAVGVPTKSIERAVGVILDGHTVPFDVGRAETADGEQRYFLCVLSTGFDSMVNERANSMTRPSGDARYVVAMLAELRRFSPIPYRVLVDGTLVCDDAMLVSLGNGPSFGGGMLVCPGADLHDGLLDMLWVHRISRPELVRVFPRLYSGRHVEHPAVTEQAVGVVRLEAPDQIAYADGERVGPLPVDVRTVSDGVRILVPR
jgi:diacylglycerol kinase (ATP)